MRRGRERSALRGDEGLDSFGGAIEAPGEIGDLVGTAHLDTRREITGAERLDLCTESLQSARDPSRDRVRPERDRGRERRDADHPAESLVRVMSGERAAVGKPHGEHRAVLAVRAAALEVARVGGGEQRADVGDQAAVRVAQRHVGFEVPREKRERGLGFGCRRVRRWKRARDHRAHALEEPPSVVARRADHAPREPDQEREDDQDRDHHQVDLQVQASHQESPSSSPSSSWRRANT